VSGEAKPDLFGQANHAWQQGRHGAAGKLLEALIEAEPRHVAGLNALGLIAIHLGDSAAALGHFETAAAIQPSPGLWFNHFQALEIAGDLEACMASLDRALGLDPYYLPAILKKAELLETLGRADESLALYRAIIAAKPSLEAVLDSVRQGFARGVGVVRGADEARSAALEVPLAEVRAAFPGADFERAQAYAEQKTGRRKVFVQQPVNGHFPYLPALEYFPRDHFGWLATLEARTGEIRRELLSLLQEGDKGFRPYIAFGPGDPVNQWAELNHSPKWSAWFFWEDGARQDSNCARCPATAALLDELPLLDLPGKGPTALFSILEPHSRIPAHTGSSNVRATVHLPLIVPQGCGLRVGSQTREFEVGRAWAFDDTIEHEAWNESGDIRAILILDTWNPLLTEAERAAIRIIG
jgi:aspartate beta-hydroxylase